ncbi:MAG: carbon-nitrogen hydrolase family protein [Chloroflexi bacterium]|nr:carbon-nitrogen hydrolase family protein [Chloroflexota bacterium]
MPRKIKVVTVSMPPKGNTVADNWQRALSLLDAACAQQPDLICLPESMLHVGTRRADWPTGVQTLPGAFIDELAARARTHHTYIVGSLYTETHGCFGNKAIVIDRKGAVVGEYDKIHPTINEIQSGVKPGNEAAVIETDFGRLGLAICYDIGWPEHWATLAQQGAEIIVWPSAYDGGFPLQVYAWTHFYYVVSSVWGDHSKVIDISGRVLASTSHWSRLISTEIDLEKEVFHIDDQVEKLLCVQTELGDRVRAEGFSQENIFTLESNDPAWPLARIKATYGLENFRDYHARATQAQGMARQSLVASGQLA